MTSKLEHDLSLLRIYADVCGQEKGGSDPVLADQENEVP